MEKEKIGLDGPENLISEKGFTAKVPRMEIRIKSDCADNINSMGEPTVTASAVHAITEYIKDSANEYIIAICNVVYEAVNYCICAKGGTKYVDGRVAISTAIKAALLTNATSITIVHNHPQGEAQPSPEDLEFLFALVHLCDMVDVEVEDMWIVGRDGNYSCKDGNPNFFKVQEDFLEKISPENFDCY